MALAGNPNTNPLVSSITTRPARRSYDTETARRPALRSLASRTRAAGICARTFARDVRILVTVLPPALQQVLGVLLNDLECRRDVTRPHSGNGPDDLRHAGGGEFDHDLPAGGAGVDVRRLVLPWGQEDHNTEATYPEDRRHPST